MRIPSHHEAINVSASYEMSPSIKVSRHDCQGRLCVVWAERWEVSGVVVMLLLVQMRRYSRIEVVEVHSSLG